jgi:hypothetical protein
MRVQFQIEGFDDQKFLSKIPIYLSIGLLKGRTQDTGEAFSPKKANIQHFKT